MKKLLVLVLSLMLCLSVFAACTENPEDGSTSAPETTETESESGTESESTSETETETPPVDEALQAALDYVHQMYKDIAEKTAANYDLVTSVTIGTDTYTVAWTVSVDTIQIVPTEGKENSVTVVVPEPDADIAYVLKATVSDAEGNSLTKEYNKIVPKFVYSTFAEYAAAEDDAPVAIIGIITGVMSKTTGSNANGLYIQDLEENGGYYVYGLTDDPNGVYKVGMTVEVKGNKDDYSGTYEIVNAKVRVIDETLKPVTPVDYTSLITNAAALNDAALVEKQGMLVTIKGATILEVGDNGYRYFQIGNHKVYLRISSSNNPCTDADLEAVDKAHADNYGKVADVTGVISVYSGNFYLSPVDANAFSNITLPELNDEDRIALELGSITFPSVIVDGTPIELLAQGKTYDSVKFTWEVVSDCATIADGKLNVTLPDALAAITLKVTAKSGDKTEVKEFAIKATKVETPEQIVNAAYALAGGDALTGEYKLTGVITKIDTVYSAEYKNITVTIVVNGLTDKPIQCFRLSGTGAETLKEGDTVTVKGPLSSYVKNDTATIQVNKGQIVVAMTDDEAVDAAWELKPGETLGEQTLTGVITKIDDPYNEQYKNITVTIVVNGKDDKPIVCFRIKGEGAAELKVGDNITVTGELLNYADKNDPTKGTVEFSTGTFVLNVAPHDHVYTTLLNKCDICGEITEHTCKDDNTDTKCDLCDELLVIPEYTCADANELEIDDPATVSGTVSVIDGKNVIIKDATGTFQLYNPTNLADIGLGDTISVTGAISEYNGTKQISDATVVISVDHSAGTCTYPTEGLTAVCTVCGVVNPAHTEHTDANSDSKCDVCDKEILPEGVEEIKYTFADYPAGEQYAKNEAHVLDEILTVTTNDAHFTIQIRLYDSSSNNGTAVFSSTRVIDKIVINAGNKKGDLTVYGSTDGTTWTEIKVVTTTSTTYLDYEVEIENSAYTFIKLDATGGEQIRVQAVTMTYAPVAQ